MKNNYFRWAFFGFIFGSFYAYRKYTDDTKLHITHSNLEWFLITAAYIGTYILVVMGIMFILRRMRKES